MEPVSIRSYHALIESTEKPFLYSNPWWLDAACGAGGWNALVHHDSNQTPLAALPYQRSRIRGMIAITTPPLTQWIQLVTKDGAPVRENAFSLSGLPKSPILDISIKPDDRIDLQGFSASPALKYSFIIPPSADVQTVRASYNEGLRRNLRQARELHTIEESNHLQGFLGLCRRTYQDRQMKPPAWFENVIERVYHQISSHHCGTLTIATAQGQIIAGILTAWDRYTSYYLAGGKVGGEHGTAAHALLLDQAIQDSCARGTAFDFEGSMHPGIANFFQSFGAIPVSYWHIKKYRGVGRLWAVLKK